MPMMKTLMILLPASFALQGFAMVSPVLVYAVYDTKSVWPYTPGGMPDPSIPDHAGCAAADANDATAQYCDKASDPSCMCFPNNIFCYSAHTPNCLDEMMTTRQEFI